MRVLGIVPARAGSKTIPHKNTALLCGRPLIEYTFDAACSSSFLTRIVVSTDCEHVKELAAQRRDLEVIHRPEGLSRDDTPMFPVVRHALSVAGEPYDAVMILHPTCPMRRTSDIDLAIQQMRHTDASSVISYVDVGANHPARMAYITYGVPQPLQTLTCQWVRKQDLPPVYIRSGDIYLTRTEWIERGSLSGDKPRAYIIPPERHCNIDGPRDLKWAELLMQSDRQTVNVSEPMVANGPVDIEVLEGVTCSFRAK